LSHRSRTGAIVAVFIAVVMAVGASIWGRAPKSAEVSPKAAPTPAVEIEHAPWRIKTVAAGHRGRRGPKKARRLVKRHRPQVREAIVDVYDALFLDTDRRREVFSRRFTPPAARSLRRSQAGVPAEAERVKIVARRASIGIESLGARQAAARTTVRARGRIDGRGFRVRHQATIWLERPKNRWRVIAFDVRQRPVR
jgi:hypothetical protein